MTTPYLKLQGRQWWARFQVPLDVREALGKREEWVKLHTEDLTTAKARAPREASQFRARVLEARGNAGSVVADALYWRRLIDADAKAGDESTGTSVYEAAVDAAADKYVQGGRKALAREANVHHEGDEVEALLALGGTKSATFVDIAIRGRKPLLPFVLPWFTIRQTEVELRTATMDKVAVERFVKAHPLLDDVTKASAKAWAQARKTEGNVSAKTVTREVSGIRSFWGYLKDRGELPEKAHDLLTGLSVQDRRKDVASAKRERFTAAEVATLYEMAQANGDAPLADLIGLAAYTGARREELCALSVENVGKDWLKITDAKTDAGTREVPIHPRLRDTLKRLIGKRKTGFVIEGLDENKHGQRGDAIGKRFTRLKAKAGHGGTKVFHSIRHTVSNMLETAGVAENLTADIVGHAKTTMSYGIYSGRGATREMLPAALANLRYPEPL